MEKSEPQPIENVHSELENQFNELNEINDNICSKAHHFSILNSKLQGFLTELETLDGLIKEEQEIFLGKRKRKNTRKMFRSKSNLISKFKQLSKSTANFISTFSSKYLADDFTTENFQKIRERFFSLSEHIRNKNQINQNRNYLLINQKMPKSILYQIHIAKSAFDNTKIIMKNPDETFTDDEDIYPPLNKFYASLQATYERLIEKVASQNATNDDSRVYQRHPNPKMLAENQNFQRYVTIYQKLKKAIAQIISELQPYYTKIHRKQQQITAIIANITAMLSTMDQTLKRFENERDRFTDAITVYQKINLIDSAIDSYEFFNPCLCTDDVCKFLNDENMFFKDADGLVRFTKIKSSIIVSDVNDEKTLTLTQLDDLLMVFNNYNKYIFDCIRNFQYKRDAFQLQERLARKEKLITNFSIKYKRDDKPPSRELIAGRRAYKHAVQSKEKCGFECINTDIFQSINSLSKIEEATSQFSSIFNLFKENHNAFEDDFLSRANEQWENELTDEFNNMIRQKKMTLDELTSNLQKETEIKECVHQKTICIATCGHTFCDECLDVSLLKCPKCNESFTENDIIHINW